MIAEVSNWKKGFDEYLLAGRADTPRSVMRLLSLSPLECVRQRVAENVSAPHAVLRALSKDADADVRIAIAHNSRTPSAVLSSLARDNNPDVRLAMAENPYLPLYVLSILAADENPYVSQRATKTIADAQADRLKRLKAVLTDRIKSGVVELLANAQPCA